MFYEVIHYGYLLSFVLILMSALEHHYFLQIIPKRLRFDFK